MVFPIKNIILESFGTGKEINNYIRNQVIRHNQLKSISERERQYREYREKKLELEARIANNKALMDTYQPYVRNSSTAKSEQKILPEPDITNPYNRVTKYSQNNFITKG